MKWKVVRDPRDGDWGGNYWREKVWREKGEKAAVIWDMGYGYGVDTGLSLSLGLEFDSRGNCVSCSNAWRKV